MRDMTKRRYHFVYKNNVIKLGAESVCAGPRDFRGIEFNWQHAPSHPPLCLWIPGLRRKTAPEPRVDGGIWAFIRRHEGHGWG